MPQELHFDPAEQWNPGDQRSDRPAAGLGSGFAVSLILHLVLAALILLGLINSPAQRGAIPPEQVVTVRLLGEVPKLDQPPPAPPAPPAAARPPVGREGTEAEMTDSQRPGPPADFAPPEPPASATPPPAAAALEPPLKAPDGQPLGPKAEAKPKPPEIKKRQTPPPKPTPPKVAEDQPPPPKAAARPPRPGRSSDPSDPRNVYEMLNRAVGRDTVAQTLGTPQGDQVDQEMRRYFQRIMAKIRAHWQPPPQVSTKLQVRFIWAIEVDGRVSSVQMAGSSGNRDYDRSVERALRNASPLPPLPPAFGGKRYVMDTIFRPETW